MSNEKQETIADIVSEMRIGDLCAVDTAARSMYINDFLTSYADRIEAAYKHEVDAILKDRDEMFKSEQETVAKTKAWFEEYQTLKREVAELRECLNEAIREKCPFTRMMCKHGEPCEYECGTDKWRKALQDEGGAK